MTTTPRVILVHGMWSRADVWDRWRDRFERAGFGCTPVTLPGHEDGPPDNAVAGMGIADYVAAVAREAARWERPVLIGHSLGGLVAQIVASQTSLAAMVLVSSAAPGQIFPLRPVMLPGLARHFAKPGLWRQAFRLSRREADYLLFNALPTERRGPLYARLTAESGRVAYQAAFGRLNLMGSNRVDTARIVCPVFVLAGARDHIVPIAVSRRIAALYMHSHSIYTEYDRHAHWMLDEPGADDRCADIIAWLNANGAGGVGKARGRSKTTNP